MAGAIVVLPLDLHQNPRRQAVIRSPLLFSISQKSRRSCALRSMQLLTAHRPAAALKSPRRSRTGSPRTARGRNKRSGISHHVRDASRGEGGRKGRATGERAGPRASSRAGPPSTADLKSDRSHRDSGSPASKPKVRPFNPAPGAPAQSRLLLDLAGPWPPC